MVPLTAPMAVSNRVHARMLWNRLPELRNGPRIGLERINRRPRHRFQHLDRCLARIGAYLDNDGIVLADQRADLVGRQLPLGNWKVYGWGHFRAREWKLGR